MCISSDLMHTISTVSTPSEALMVHTSGVTPTKVGGRASKSKKTVVSASPRHSYNRYAPASEQQSTEPYHCDEQTQLSRRYLLELRSLLLETGPLKRMVKEVEL